MADCGRTCSQVGHHIPKTVAEHTFRYELTGCHTSPKVSLISLLHLLDVKHSQSPVGGDLIGEF